MKDFIFLYPIDEYFDKEFGKEFLMYERRSIVNVWYYMKILNSAIEQRYRKKGFRMNFLVFDDKEVSSIVEIKEGDIIRKVGMNFWRHYNSIKEKENHYPDTLPIIRELEQNIVVAGFHLLDCVDRFASEAYSLGRNVIVDEDLTDKLKFRLGKIKIEEYPSFIHSSRIFTIREMHKETKPWWA